MKILLFFTCVFFGFSLYSVEDDNTTYNVEEWRIFPDSQLLSISKYDLDENLLKFQTYRNGKVYETTYDTYLNNRIVESITLSSGDTTRRNVYSYNENIRTSFTYYDSELYFITDNFYLTDRLEQLDSIVFFEIEDYNNKGLDTAISGMDKYSYDNGKLIKCESNQGLVHFEIEYDTINPFTTRTITITNRLNQPHSKSIRTRSKNIETDSIIDLNSGASFVTVSTFDSQNRIIKKEQYGKVVPDCTNSGQMIQIENISEEASEIILYKY